MSPSPVTSSSTASPSTSSIKSDATPKADHRILIVVVILVIAAVLLISYIVYITLRLKRQQTKGEKLGPYQGTVMHQDHPAANITPFGTVGPHSGWKVPRYKHNPGEEMRIAIRRPDGAWHFADSRTPFTPVGVSEIDVVPSPISSSYSTGMFSFQSPSYFPSNKSKVAPEQYHVYDDSDFGFDPNPFAPPPPAYFRESPRDPFDDRRKPA